MPAVSLLIKPASGMCNLRCRYCFYYDITTKREFPSYGFMTGETLEILVQKTLSFAEGSCTFAFQGGEPTLVGLPFYQRLIELEERYNIHQVQILNTLQTNGFLIDDEWAAFLSAHHFLVGLSLDGIKSTHDCFRKDASGNGTFDRIMKTIRLFNTHKVEYNILTVVHKETARKAGRIYSFYKKNGLQYLQFIACLDPLGELQGHREYSLTPQDYGSFLCEIFDLWYADLQKGEQPFIRQFENYIAILLGRIPEACEQRGVCSFQHIVEADGSVYPCDFYVTDAYRLGNLRVDSFADIAHTCETLGFIQESLNHPETCKRCPYFALCRGGCRRHRELSEDHLNYFCKGYQMFFAHALPRLMEIARYCR
ncbi:MAG TPA: anaerobic sulfatase maturase [Lachnospiraceae bacterium]|nr:anaerobic sulfatase maturase [Lachnospiraceae bacterium]